MIEVLNAFCKFGKRLPPTHSFQPLPNSAIRLLHGRGKEFPGFEHVTIEWLPPYLLIVFHPSWHRPCHHPRDLEIQTAIKEFFTHLVCPQILGIFIQIRDNEGRIVWEVLKGTIPETPVVVPEGDRQFLINFGADQNIGLFLDMHPLRVWLSKNASSKKVLNLFSYTCSLSVAAKMGMASEVHNVDMRKNFLTWGRQNHQLNQCENKIFYHHLDILKSFGRLKRLGPFDLVIIDPPSHQKSFSIVHDYPRLLKRVSEWLNSSGRLVLVANDPGLAREDFRNMAEQVLGPSFQFICWGESPTILLGNDANFPVKVAFYTKLTVC